MEHHSFRGGVMTSTSDVRERLRGIVDPCTAATGSHLDIVEMGLVKDIDVSDGIVTVDIRLTTPACHMVPYFIKEIQEHVEPLPGVDSVKVETDRGLEWTEDMMSSEAREKRQEVLDNYESRLQDIHLTAD